MRMLAFASRNYKEMTRDKVTLLFGLAFPLVLILMLSLIQSNIPNEMFQIDMLTPGIAMFGLSFISLFSGMLIASDRQSSFLMRLFTTPLTSQQFITGYTLPLFPLALIQMSLCYVAAFFLGLSISIEVLFSILVLIPIAIFFIGIGLLTGSIFTDKQVGGVCGALLTNVSAWFSGAWFDVSLVGGWFESIAHALPFVHAVEASRAALAGNGSGVFPHLWWVILYAVVAIALAIYVFNKKMKVA